MSSYCPYTFFAANAEDLEELLGEPGKLRITGPDGTKSEIAFHHLDGQVMRALPRWQVRSKLGVLMACLGCALNEVEAHLEVVFAVRGHALWRTSEAATRALRVAPREATEGHEMAGAIEDDQRVYVLLGGLKGLGAEGALLIPWVAPAARREGARKESESRADLREADLQAKARAKGRAPRRAPARAAPVRAGSEASSLARIAAGTPSREAWQAIAVALSTSSAEPAELRELLAPLEGWPAHLRVIEAALQETDSWWSYASRPGHGVGLEHARALVAPSLAVIALRDDAALRSAGPATLSWSARRVDTHPRTIEAVLAASPRINELELSLTASSEPVADRDEWRSLWSSPAAERLRALSIWGPATERGLELDDLARGVIAPKLKALSLTIPGAASAVLSALGQWPRGSLRSLSLHQLDLQKTSMRAAGPAPAMADLEELSIDDLALDDLSMTKWERVFGELICWIAAGAPLALRTLEIGIPWCAPSHEQAALLLEAAPHLSTLRLGRLDEQNLIQTLSSPLMGRVELLRLGCALITPRSLRALLALPPMPRACVLELPAAAFNPKPLRALREHFDSSVVHGTVALRLG